MPRGSLGVFSTPVISINPQGFQLKPFTCLLGQCCLKAGPSASCSGSGVHPEPPGEGRGVLPGGGASPGHALRGASPTSSWVTLVAPRASVSHCPPHLASPPSADIAAQAPHSPCSPQSLSASPPASQSSPAPRAFLRST